MSALGLTPEVLVLIAALLIGFAAGYRVGFKDGKAVQQ